MLGHDNASRAAEQHVVVQLHARRHLVNVDSRPVGDAARLPGKRDLLAGYLVDQVVVDAQPEAEPSSDGQGAAVLAHVAKGVADLVVGELAVYQRERDPAALSMRKAVAQELGPDAGYLQGRRVVDEAGVLDYIVLEQQMPARPPRAVAREDKASPGPGVHDVASGDRVVQAVVLGGVAVVVPTVVAVLILKPQHAGVVFAEDQPMAADVLHNAVLERDVLDAAGYKAAVLRVGEGQA